MKIDRRTLLAAAGAGLGQYAVKAFAQEQAMHQRKIPSSGEAMPVIGLGTWQTFDVGIEPADRAQRREVLDTLFAAGGRMIDSSPMYGRSEAVVGELLAEMGAHGKAFLATKVWTSGENAGLAQMKASAEKMRAPVIDLMQIHNLVDWRVHLKSLRAAQDAGRFRYIGITHYTRPALDELAAIIEREKIDFVQMGYSLATRDAERRLLPAAQSSGVAVIANQPFDSGSMFARVKGKPLPGWAADIDCASWAQVMLKYIISHPAVTCVIPGTARPDHMRDNLGSGVGRLPDEAMRRRMAEEWESS